jgi:phosphotransferase system enzyme I (PtsI)
VQGIGVSQGIAMGKAKKIKIEKRLIEKVITDKPEEEIKKLREARKIAKEQMESLIDSITLSAGAKQAEIFMAQKTMLDDRVFFGEAEGRIRDEGINAEWALAEVSQKFIRILEALDNKLIGERAYDIHDITKRLINILQGIEDNRFSNLDEEVIIISEGLLPSEIANLDNKKVKGFITKMGSKTSHLAIIANTLEIPAIVGVDGIMDCVENGDFIALDGTTGVFCINPNEEEIEEYISKQNVQISIKAKLEKYKGLSSITKDGVRVKIVANIASINDLNSALENDAEGIGLFRTEFLYMDRESLPGESEQFAVYKETAQKMGDKPVVIRTLDIGGDKNIPYLGLPIEENPFLGFRAIRFCLDRKDIFITQLRAILRASAFGNVKIMFPMISNMTELKDAKTAIEEVKESLRKENIKYNENIEVGMMVETPATAIISDIFAINSDFFSIGTNDLTQYALAVDRGNSKVAPLYNQLHPAVLRMIKMVVENADGAGKWVGICGEAGGDPNFIPILIGMGLKEFSMTPSSILRARGVIRNTEWGKMNKIVDILLNLSTVEEIHKYLEDNVNIEIY